MTIPHSERTIDSPHNAAVRLARTLERDRSARRREGAYVAWGIHLAQEALRAGAIVRQALLGPSLEESAEGRAVLRRLRALPLPRARTTTRILDSIAPGSGDQGILLVVELPGWDAARVLESKPSLILAAHGVQDPGNLGSIVRTSLGLGARALAALEGCADPFGSRAVRAAMGAQFTLPVACGAARPLLEAFRGAGLTLVAADPEGPVTPPEVDLRSPTVLLMGNEGAGLPRAILEGADRRVRIPMAPGVASLNVHAAAAALLYEAARQRGFVMR